MEHRDWEKQIKQSLDSRKLTPSGDAWNKLERELNNDTVETKTYKWYWLVAAIAILVSGIFFTDRNEETIPEGISVVKQEKTDGVETEIIDNKEVQTKGEIVNEVIIAEKEVKISSNSHRKAEKTDVVELNRNEVFATEIKIEQPQEKELTFEEQKVVEVITKIQSLENDGTQVTDAEIDSLLETAQKEIDAHKNFINNHIRVDATALLLDVEDELDRSFKDKVFEALQIGFKKAKTAVAERNN